ncbi:hypothetical protein L1049_011379 [Liquidambar formosana]|uniref:Tyrosine-specific transport protein n=1 Tax=Liquidambar formosana TaxID=63359 RepID=A0AAP0X267_LIQFO
MISTYYACSQRRLQEKVRWPAGKVYATKENESGAQLKEKPIKVSKEKGTIAGAVALIIGTSIGTGILALPKKASPAGLLPSSISIHNMLGFSLNRSSFTR